MAKRRNYYEIIDKVPFDPPTAMTKKEIVDAIELWKFLEERRGISREEANGEQSQKELDMYENIKACLTDSQSRKAEADAMKQKQKKKLDSVIAVLKESGVDGKLSISDVRVRKIAESFRLDMEKTVKKAFDDAGFIILDRTPSNKILDGILTSNTNLGTICSNVKKLAGINSQEFPWLNQVKNLYDLAAYFNRDGKNAEIYPSKPAAELDSIMKAGMSRFPNPSLSHPEEHCFKDLFTIGHTTIFKDETAKAKYDNSLKLEKLRDLFSLLKEMPEEMKKDAYLADICIKKIQVHFPDPDVALAIYNREAGLGKDPYKPDSENVDVVCGYCNAIKTIEYVIIKDAAEKGKCKCDACGKPMFVKCSSCSRLIPAWADICPECGFNLVESKFFDRYLALAQSAIASMDIAEARKQFALAKSARPNDSKLKSLEAEINKAVKIYDEPLRAIKDLMVQGKFMEADRQLAAFCAKYSGVKVDDIKAQIDKAIAEADRLFAHVDRQADPCGVCFDILDKVKDYAKASDYIRDKKPRAVSNLTAAVSTSNNQVTLQWTGTGERKVSYCVVRKENAKPQSINDGNIVLKDQLVTQYTDSSVCAGVVYYYAVFAQRTGTYSVPATSTPCILYQELDEKNIVKNAEDEKCVLSWLLPKNCKGVRVLRSENGKTNVTPGRSTKVIAECASNGYEDRNVRNGTRYEYRLQCVYNVENGVRYSEGITFLLMPDSKPQPVTLVSANVKGKNTVQIAWDFKCDTQNSIMDLYDIQSGLNLAVGTMYPVAELPKIGAKIGTVLDISSKSCEVMIHQKKGYRLCAVTVKGEYAAVSNCISCSNYEKIDIDKERTKISRSELLICLREDFPQGITGIRYTVATKKSDSDPAPWRGMADVQEMTLLPVSTYRSDKVIMIRDVPREVLYISVVGEYRVGKEVYYSEPSHLRLSNLPKAEISYRIAWGLLGQKKNVKLIIECDRDTDLPEMQLCCSRTVEIPMSMNNGDIIRLCRIPEHINYMAHTRKEIEIPNEVWRGVASGHEMRLFFLEDRGAEFNMKPDGRSLRIP